MRLLHLETFELKEFFHEDIPPYAILSHRWDSNEVSFKEMYEGRTLDQHPGMAKIQGFCAFAKTWEPRKYVRSRWSVRLLPPVEWGWMATCCIDKSSSAELSEAINSMFSWYRKAEYCCVYLKDVASSAERTRPLEESEWFRRGWTLQELLAPRSVLFCDSSWELLGHKCTHYIRISRFDQRSDVETEQYCDEDEGNPSLNDEITRATSIASIYLQDPEKYKTASIACRMSWASTRTTTRVEDIAYCLLGIFGVNMPPLYGEGLKAFRRLQEEIVRHSNDQSIFAWSNLEPYLTAWIPSSWADPRFRGHTPTMFATSILATHPIDFLNSAEIISTGNPPEFPFTITNNGLELRAHVRQYEMEHFDGVVILALDTNYEKGPHFPLSGRPGDRRIALFTAEKSSGPLLRLHVRKNAIDVLGPLVDQGESERTIYAQTKGTFHIFAVDNSRGLIQGNRGEDEEGYRTYPWRECSGKDFWSEQASNRPSRFVIPVCRIPLASDTVLLKKTKPPSTFEIRST